MKFMYNFCADLQWNVDKYVNTYPINNSMKSETIFHNFLFIEFSMNAFFIPCDTILEN